MERAWSMGRSRRAPILLLLPPSHPSPPPLSPPSLSPPSIAHVVLPEKSLATVVLSRNASECPRDVSLSAGWRYLSWDYTSCPLVCSLVHSNCRFRRLLVLSPAPLSPPFPTPPLVPSPSLSLTSLSCLSGPVLSCPVPSRPPDFRFDVRSVFRLFFSLSSCVLFLFLLPLTPLSMSFPACTPPSMSLPLKLNRC